MSKLSEKVNFIGIGPGKCGTSWIYNVLLQHPEVCVSSSKETLFFERFWNKGEQWYHDFFQPTSPNQKCGEISNTYIFDKDVPKRIYEYSPDAKLICTIRNPVDRTFSHYLYMLRVGEESGTFDEVLKKRPDLFYRGKYAALLSEYDKFFPKEQILVLLFEDLKNRNADYTEQLMNFLEIKNCLPEEVLNKKVLGAGKARNPLLSKLVSASADLARNLGLAALVTKLKYNSTVSNFFYKEFKKGEKPVLSPEKRAELNKVFLPDVKQLSKRLGIDMVSYWGMEK